MPQDILNSLRSLREDMRQLLLQVPEYRALVALDHSIEEICMILQEGSAVAAGLPAAAPQAPAQEAPVQEVPVQEAHVQEAAPPRHSTIASAFAETLAARIDRLNGPRAVSGLHPAQRAQVG